MLFSKINKLFDFSVFNFAALIILIAVSLVIFLYSQDYINSNTNENLTGNNNSRKSDLMLSALTTNEFNFKKEYFSKDSLTVRNAHVLVYNPDKQIVMLFGGADESQVLGDLWAWDGEKWFCLSNKGPSPRTFPALSYDITRKQLVLFGGNKVLFGTGEEKNNFLNDMWIWNNNSWHEIHTPTPSARAEASMAYDSDRQRIVLFGGYRNENGERIRLGDTWEWDGQKWEQKSSEGPEPRNGTAMAFDPFNKKTILFWGSNDSGQTWEWDGKKWEQINSADTLGCFNSTMAYDTKTHSLIRFGGWAKGNRVNDTWSYNGDRWIKISSEGPAARNHASMAYDSKRNVIVLFGGHDGDHVFGDTWEWNGKKWLLRKNIPPRLRVNNSH